MSKKALDPINLLTSASAPTVPTLNIGDTYFDTTAGLAYVYNGTTWVAMGSSSSGVSQIIAGTNITISPSGGTGAVTINASSATSSPAGFPYVTGRFYVSPIALAGSGSFSAVLQTTYYMPIYIRQTQTFTKIGVNSGSTAAVNALIRVGIFNDSGAGAPSTVLLDAGTTTMTASSQPYFVTISQSLSAGWYWLAVNAISSTGSVAVPFLGYTANTGNYWWPMDLGMPQNPVNVGGGQYVYYTQAAYNATSGYTTAGTLTALKTTSGPVVGLVP